MSENANDSKESRVIAMEQLVTALALGAGHDLDDLRADGMIS
ncbi:hypothetical protein [Microbacterium sp.]